MTTLAVEQSRGAVERSSMYPFLLNWRADVTDAERPHKSSITVELAPPIDESALNFRFRYSAEPQERAPFIITGTDAVAKCHYPPTGHDVDDDNCKILKVYYRKVQTTAHEESEFLTGAMWRLLDHINKICAQAHEQYRVDPHTRFIEKRR